MFYYNRPELADRAKPNGDPVDGMKLRCKYNICCHFSLCCACDDLVSLHKVMQPALQLTNTNSNLIISKPAPLNKQTSLSNHVSIVHRTPRRTHWQVKSKSPPSPTGSYLQVGSLQPAVHVLLPRERQLSLRWTGHGVHASGGNAPRSQCVGKVKTDWTRCWLPLGASRRLKGPRTAPNEAPGVVPGHS